MRKAPAVGGEGRPLKVLLVRTDRIGDVVLSLPAAAMIKDHIPGSEVHFLTRAYTEPLAAMAPGIDGVIEDRPEEGCRALSRRLRERRFDAAVLLHPTARLAAALWLAGIPLRAGTAFRYYSLLLNRRVPLHRRNSGRHELELNLELASRGLALEMGNAGEYYPKIAVDPKLAASLRARFDLAGDAELVVVHPGSGGSARDWPLQYFAGLMDLLSEKGLQVAVTLGPGEEGLRQKLESSLRSRPVWVSGLGLGELAALLSLARLVISNSTGPMHVATAVGSRALGIFCPVIPCLPRRWGPYGHGHGIMMPEVPQCQECLGVRCPHWDCMESVTVEQVLRKALEMAEQHP